MLRLTDRAVRCAAVLRKANVLMGSRYFNRSGIRREGRSPTVRTLPAMVVPFLLFDEGQKSISFWVCFTRSELRGAAWLEVDASPSKSSSDDHAKNTPWRHSTLVQRSQLCLVGVSSPSLDLNLILRSLLSCLLIEESKN